MTRITAVLGWREADFSMWMHALRLRLRPLGLMRVRNRIGLTDRYRLAAERKFPPDLRDAGLALALTSTQRRADIHEVTGFRRSVKQIQAEAGKLGDLPVTVLTSTEHDPNHAAGSRAAQRRQRWYPTWAEMQASLTALSTNSRHLVAERSGHHIHLDEPDLVVDAIQEMCADATRTPSSVDIGPFDG
jgi:pimeloyl-ACP methyl ester carboxylesterase